MSVLLLQEVEQVVDTRYLFQLVVFSGLYEYYHFFATTFPTMRDLVEDHEAIQKMEEVGIDRIIADLVHEWAVNLQYSQNEKYPDLTQTQLKFLGASTEEHQRFILYAFQNLYVLGSAKSPMDLLQVHTRQNIGHIPFYGDVARQIGTMAKKVLFDYQANVLQFPKGTTREQQLGLMFRIYYDKYGFNPGSCFVEGFNGMEWGDFGDWNDSPGFYIV